MSKYIGKTQSFLLHGRMIPFKVERHVQVDSIPEIGLPAEDYLYIKSLDLQYEAQISTSKWDEQARRLELMRNEQSAQQSVQPTDGGLSQADNESNPPTISG